MLPTIMEPGRNSIVKTGFTLHSVIEDFLLIEKRCAGQANHLIKA